MSLLIRASDDGKTPKLRFQFIVLINKTYQICVKTSYASQDNSSSDHPFFDLGLKIIRISIGLRGLSSWLCLPM